MARYQIETTLPSGQTVTVPISDEFLDLIRKDHARELADMVAEKRRVIREECATKKLRRPVAYLTGLEIAEKIVRGTAE